MGPEAQETDSETAGEEAEIVSAEPAQEVQPETAEVATEAQNSGSEAGESATIKDSD
jgi:hypothetical protein